MGRAPKISQESELLPADCAYAVKGTLINNSLERLERAVDARLDARITEVARGRAMRQRGGGWAVAATVLLSCPVVGVAGGLAGAAGEVSALVVVPLISLLCVLRR